MGKVIRTLRSYEIEIAALNYACATSLKTCQILLNMLPEMFKRKSDWKAIEVLLKGTLVTLEFCKEKYEVPK